MIFLLDHLGPEIQNRVTRMIFWKHGIIYCEKKLWLNMKQKYCCSYLLGRTLTVTALKSLIHAVFYEALPSSKKQSSGAT